MVSGRGGELAVAALSGYGIGEVFTPAGEHVPAIHDAARAARMRVVEVRHEQTAVFAAEAVATLLRRPGLAVLGAGPGVTNAVSAITAAHFNAAPVVVLAGRAPAWRWGSGSLPALDHVAIVDSVTRSAATCTEVGNIGADVRAAVLAALTPHRGPAFLDLPMDVVFCAGEAELPAATLPAPIEPDPAAVARAGALLAAAERPVIVAGSDVYGSDAVAALRECAETWRIPVFTTGLARGALPGDHPLAFRCCKRAALARADLVAVLGTAPDLRLGGGTDARLIHVVDAPPAVDGSPGDDGTLWVAGDLRLVLSGMADHRGVRADHADWIELLRVAEDTARAQEAGHLADDREPIRATRLYAELRRALTDDAIIVGDGGDVVSAAARHLGPAGPAAGWTAAGTATAAPASATRSAPRWPARTARCAGCSATAPPPARYWRSSRWSGTTCRSCWWSATTAASVPPGCAAPTTGRRGCGWRRWWPRSVAPARPSPPRGNSRRRCAARSSPGCRTCSTC
jgi:acetolactate synthase-1/2/3 large subunit